MSHELQGDETVPLRDRLKRRHRRCPVASRCREARSSQLSAKSCPLAVLSLPSPLPLKLRELRTTRRQPELAGAQSMFDATERRRLEFSRGYHVRHPEPSERRSRSRIHCGAVNCAVCRTPSSTPVQSSPGRRARCSNRSASRGRKYSAPAPPMTGRFFETSDTPSCTPAGPRRTTKSCC
jgi:hypothetical protein